MQFDQSRRISRGTVMRPEITLRKPLSERLEGKQENTIGNFKENKDS